MWTSIERELDGVVGRFLSWLTHPPVRPFKDLEEPVEPVPATVSETVTETVSGIEDAAKTLGKATRKAAGTASRAKEAVAETADEVAGVVTETAEKVSEAVAARARKVPEKAAVAKDAARRAEAAIETDLDLDAAVVEPETGEGDELDDRLLAALAKAPKGASMKQLEKATGCKPRQRLKELIRAGRVERRGEGMRIRFYLAEG